MTEKLPKTFVCMRLKKYIYVYNVNICDFNYIFEFSEIFINLNKICKFKKNHTQSVSCIQRHI